MKKCILLAVFGFILNSFPQVVNDNLGFNKKQIHTLEKVKSKHVENDLLVTLNKDISKKKKDFSAKDFDLPGCNQVVVLSKSIREAIDKKRYIDISTLTLPNNIHLYGNHKDFCKAYIECENDKRILAYSNRVVDSYNSNISYKNGKYNIGDLLVLNKPLGSLTNGSIVEVLKVVEFEKYFDIEVNSLPYSKVIKIFKTKGAKDEYLNLNGDPSGYWDRVDQVYDPKHLYSSTIHKSQGQSIESVFIDLTDIYSAMTRKPTRFNNFNKPISIQDYMKLIYVAISRMKKEAHIFIGKSRDYKKLRSKDGKRQKL